MLNETNLNNIRNALKRIFALPITKLTFLQIQNMLRQTIQDKDEHAEFMQSLLSGSFVEFSGEVGKNESMRALLDEFCIPSRIAKEVEERGEILQFITSETIDKSGTSYIYHRMRRIDGEEFIFFTDSEATVLLLEHFSQRLKGFKEMGFQEKYGERLKKLSESIERSVE